MNIGQTTPQCPQTATATSLTVLLCGEGRKRELTPNFSEDILKPVYGNATLQTAVKSNSEAHS